MDTPPPSGEVILPLTAKQATLPTFTEPVVPVPKWHLLVPEPVKAMPAAMTMSPVFSPVFPVPLIPIFAEADVNLID
jgi:hypothetical protein